MIRFSPLLALVFLPIAPVSVLAVEAVPADHAERMTKGAALFRSDVAGILKEHCLKCHGGEKTKSDFDLVTREGLLRGGKEGVAVKPFSARESVLLKMTRSHITRRPVGSRARAPQCASSQFNAALASTWIGTESFTAGSELVSMTRRTSGISLSTSPSFGTT